MRQYSLGCSSCATASTCGQSSPADTGYVPPSTPVATSGLTWLALGLAVLALSKRSA